MNITRNDLSPLVTELKKEAGCCAEARRKSYTSGEMIQEFSPKSTNHIGVVLSGEAVLYTIDLYGNRNIMELLSPDNVFGEMFAVSGYNAALYVEAKTSCEILHLSYDNLMHRCNNTCAHHEALVGLMFQISSIKSQESMAHLGIVSQRSTQSKLLTLFLHLGLSKENPAIDLPYSWTDIADYICVERSAMMRELRKMNQEGMIVSSGRHVTMAG